MDKYKNVFLVWNQNIWKCTNMGYKKNLEVRFVEKLVLWLFPYTFSLSEGSEPKGSFK